jgi:hypothetical protein
MIKEYQIAAIVKIQAHSYEEALKEAELRLTLKTSNDDETVDLVYDYESDNEGQRVVYLPAIDCTCPDADDVAVNAADSLSHDALNVAAKNGAELGTCDEDD